MAHRTNKTTQNEKPYAVVGAGLVGSLLAIYLSKRGYKTEIYERRSDMRKEKISAGKSINLALSDRGWKALQGVGIADEIKKISIPMKGRMVHNADGKTQFLPYGKDGQAIYSVSRAGLNCMLMDLAEKHGAKIYFNRRCTDIESSPTTAGERDSGTVSFRVEDTIKNKQSVINAERIFGTDGAFSAVRLHVQLTADRFEYSQHYLNYGYKELLIPPLKDGSFALEKNCLHIWARGTFMMIALPNIDGSFTCTLFFPFEGMKSFAVLNTPDKVKNFFTETFPDAVPIMPTLLHDFLTNPTASLVTIRCYPWSVDDKILLVGDAAHGVVPFYGQGMNCGFEDCTVLEQVLEKHFNSQGKVKPPHENEIWNAVFKEFQEARKPNADAIADLAISNFLEMRDLVTHPDFILQKKIESHFSALHPNVWIPLYSMVTFSDLPYSTAMKMGAKQDAIMKKILAIPGIEQKWNSSEVEGIMLRLANENIAPQ